MIDLVSKKIPRGASFVAFNASAVVFLVLFVFAPLCSHFASRSEDIAENAAQLSHFRSVVRNSSLLKDRAHQAGDPFLPGNEERIVSADLQANLKAIGTTAGIRFLGIRGLQSSSSQQLHMVAVSMQLEGSLSTVRDVVVAIENQMPMLFVTMASIRSASDGDDSLVRVELTVQGAMHGSGSSSGDGEAISQ